MHSKENEGEALRIFCQEFGVPDKLTFDGSQEQNGKRTEFMQNEMSSPPPQNVKIVQI